MMTFFFAGAGVMFAGCLLFIILFMPRTRKLPCFAPRGSLVSKALQARMKPKQWYYDRYMRRV